MNKKRGVILLVFLLLIPFVIGEGIQIKNLGVLGFNDTNNEFTSIRSVLLELNYSQSTPTGCRYKNNDSSWTPYETCIDEKYWLISASPGLKNVTYQINDSGTLKNFSDTIYYNYTGAGLDTTPPSTVTIYDGEYSNSNLSVNLSWSEAVDAESDILNIPLIYSYQILVNSAPNSSWITTGTTTSLNYAVNLNHNDNVTIKINATNSAGLISTAASNGLLIDLVLPNDTQKWTNIPLTGWNGSSNVFFNWTSNDDFSGIAGFSYTFTTDSSISPDEVPEGEAGNLENHLNKTFTVSKTGIYRFKIKAVDKAGNWGNITSTTIKIDKTPPSKPILIGADKVFGLNIINFTWSSSVDDEAGINYYLIEVWNTTNFNYSTDYWKNYTVANDTYHYELDTATYNPLRNYTNYYARIKAYDNAKNPSVWSNEQSQYDWTPPVITVIKPGSFIQSGINPILALKTDEKANCYYQNNSGNFVLFKYTNQTYHETKPKTLLGQYNFSCYDLSGNQETANTGGVTPQSGNVTINNIPAASGFVNKVIAIPISLAENRGEVSKSRFSVYINSSSYDFTIYDNGSGIYSVNILSPKTPGTYTLQINVDAASDSDTLTVNPLELTATYTETFSSYSNFNRITFYNETNYTAGFASDAASVSLGTANNLLNITSGNDGKIYFFATKKVQRPEEKDKRLRYKTFESQNMPSFGYLSSEYTVLKTVLSYPGIDIAGNETIGSGSKNFLIKRVRSKSKKKVLITSKVSIYTDEGVIQYG